MEKEKYKELDIYQRSVELLNSFVKEVLDGDINGLAFFCLGDLEHDLKGKYTEPTGLSRGKQSDRKWLFDPDDTALARAGYCVLWGHLFNIGVDEEHFIGSCTEREDIAAPYRGDTMNSFNSVLGEPLANIPRRLKMYGLEKNIDIMAQARTFYRTYHMIGNMILLPNRKECLGFNRGRADYKNGLRDYFDLFLMNIYEYQNPGKVKFDQTIIKNGESVRQLMEDNPEYMDLKIEDMKSLFELDDYFDGDVPKNILGSDIARFKITKCLDEVSKTEDHYTKEEYIKLVITYMDKCTELIHARSMRLVKRIKEEISEKN